MEQTGDMPLNIPYSPPMYKISYYLPDLALVILFTLPPGYDTVIGIRGLYRRLTWVW
jgi:hypothetical protein